MKLAICFFVSILVISVSSEKIPCTREGEVEFDEKAVKLMIYEDWDSKLPESDEEFDEYYKKIEKYSESIKDYGKRCLDEDAKSMVIVTTEQFDQTNRDVRKNKKFDMIKSAKCWNDNKDKLIPCSDDLKVMLKDAAETLPNDKKFAATCCGYFTWKKCIMTNLTSSRKCPERAKMFFDILFDHQAMDTMKFLCPIEYFIDPYACKSVMDNIKPVEERVKWKSLFKMGVELLKSINK